MKKAQVWIFDAIAGISVFILLITIFIFFSQASTTQDSKLGEVYEDTVIVSSSLIESGYPRGWDATTVEEVGLTDGNYRLNESKVDELIILTQSDYDKSKLLLKTKYDYLIFFENQQGEVLTTIAADPYIGYASVTKDNVSQVGTEAILSMRRLVAYQNAIITMVVYVWE